MGKPIQTALRAESAGLPPISLRLDDSRGGQASGHLNVLLLSSLFKLPYRVLRCAEAAGANVFVLGSAQAKGLTRSRCCRQFVLSANPIDGSRSPDLAAEINALVDRFSIDIAIAADAPATRSLIGIRELLDCRCFPMPELEQFDLLNDKWRFHNLCSELGIACPQTRLFARAEDVLDEIERGALACPLVAKPLNLDGGRGYVRIPPDRPKRFASEIFYSPIIVQEYIDGVDIGASMYCSNGEIEAFLTHRYDHHIYMAYNDEDVYNTLLKISRRLTLNGVYNFDMRLTPDHRVLFLECNPRVFYKMSMSMLAGINFLEPGLTSRRREGQTRMSGPVALRFPRAMLPPRPAPRGFDCVTWPVLRFLFEDPVPFVCEKAGLDRDGGRRYA